MGKIRLPGQMPCRVFHFDKMYSFVTRIKTSVAGEQTGSKLKSNLQQFFPLCQSFALPKKNGWRHAKQRVCVCVTERERDRESQ